MNVFRERGWLDAPPADFKWAILTVTYDAPEDPLDDFPEHSTREPASRPDGVRAARPARLH